MKEFDSGKVHYLKETEEKEKLLEQLNFVYLPGGKVQMGSRFPLPCRFEGIRKNETPRRILEVGPFWIARFCVTNAEYELFDPKHSRPPTAPREKNPVTNITYFNALNYAKFLSEKYGLNFRLPTEPEWVFAAAPFGWELPYKRGPKTKPEKAHTYSSPEDYYTLDVDDPSDINYCGLYQISGNVSEITYGHWYIPIGHWGAETDGMYCIVKGGNFGLCPFSAGIHRRDIMGVAARSERVGFRLAHPDLRNQ